MRAAGAKEAAPVAIGIDISDGMLTQFGGVSFGPFSRAEQPWFFAVPEAVNNGAIRLPALLQQFPQRARLLHFRTRSRDGIARAVDPRIMMIAADNPFIGIL